MCVHTGRKWKNGIKNMKHRHKLEAVQLYPHCVQFSVFLFPTHRFYFSTSNSKHDSKPLDTLYEPIGKVMADDICYG